MSLDFQLDRIDPATRAAYPPEADGALNHVTTSVVLATMVVGMCEITADTADEFYFRTSFADQVYGADPTARVTIRDVLAHIGLTTNAREFSRAEFLERMAAAHARGRFTSALADEARRGQDR